MTEAEKRVINLYLRRVWTQVVDLPGGEAYTDNPDATDTHPVTNAYGDARYIFPRYSEVSVTDFIRALERQKRRVQQAPTLYTAAYKKESAAAYDKIIADVNKLLSQIKTKREKDGPLLINHYSRERYPLSAINEFVGVHPLLVAQPALSLQACAVEPVFKNSRIVKSLGFFGPATIELLYSDRGYIMLALHEVEVEPGDPDNEKMYQLYYIHSVCAGAWIEFMNREIYFTQTPTYSLTASNIGNFPLPNNPASREEGVKLFNYYKDNGHGSVALWASNSPDPIMEYIEGEE